MANAFADATAVLHADLNLSEPATYYAGGAGPGQALRVIRSAPIAPAFGPAGGMGSLQPACVVDMLIADVPTQPSPGDLLLMGSETFRVESAERDDLRLTWRLILAEEA
jgi:hypothetical protein